MPRATPYDDCSWCQRIRCAYPAQEDTMYALDNAVAHDLQHQRLARADHARLASTASGAPQAARRRRASAPHPVRGFYRWLARDQ